MRGRTFWRGTAIAWGACCMSLGAAAAAAAEPDAPARSLEATALDRLPPGVREAQDATPRIARATYGDRLVERFDRGESGSADWLEVEYTMEPALQRQVRALLEAEAIALGHVVVMDPRSGDLLAYVSTAPQRFPATRSYPAASLMKVATTAALLRHAPEAAQDTCRSSGSPYELAAQHLGGGGHDAASESAEPAPPTEEDPLDVVLDRAMAALDHEWVGDLRAALAMSNNQCFGRYAAVELGERSLHGEIETMGLLEAPGRGHAPGSISPVKGPLDLGNLGSGLAGSWISPLGAVRMAALLASGELVTPHWIAEIRDAQGLALDRERAAPRSIWHPDMAQELRDLLRGVTEFGTASRAFQRADGSPRLGPVSTAGKTGTLSGEDPDGLYQWFIGVAPAEAPTVAIATVVVHEEQRGASASKLAGGVLESVFCDADGHCNAARADRFRARSDARALQVARSRREAVAAAQSVEAPLDASPRPIAGTQLDLPRRLLRRPVSGEIVVRVALEADGRVEQVSLESSTLPARFDAFVLESVEAWRFTPPQRFGRPVRAEARLAIPIHVN